MFFRRFYSAITVDKALQALDVINCSFATGSYPDRLKSARVVPIHKGGDRSVVSNYRPISILPVLNKVIEKCLASRIYDFLDRRSFFFDGQFGFRPRSNTTLACMEVTEHLLSALDDSKFAVGMFFDLSKAFDSVDHRLLLAKLYRAGLRGDTHCLVRDYLAGRSQRVQVGGALSDSRPIGIGVAQGSNLGPLLYSMFVNDIGRLDFRGKLVMYADDTCLMFSNETVDGIMADIRHDLQLMSDFYLANRLTLNMDKTRYMLFGRRWRYTRPVEVFFGNVALQRVSTYKYLGLHLDERLCFDVHVDEVCTKVSRVCGLLFRVRKFVPRHAMLNVYYALIHSHIVHLLEIYGCADRTILDRVFLLQKRALKTIFGFDRLYPTEELFACVSRFGILPVKALYYRGVFVYAVKILRGLVHSGLVFSRNAVSVRTRSAGGYFVPSSRMGYGNRRYMYVGCRLVNEFLHLVDGPRSLSVVRRLFTQELYSNGSRMGRMIRVGEWTQAVV